MKIGIAGTGIAYNRLADHQRHGWDPASYVHPCDTGEQAAQIEGAVKRALQASFGTQGFISREKMPQGGWTETFPETHVPPAELQRLVQSAATRVQGSSKGSDG